jgi:hypothetical protein
MVRNYNMHRQYGIVVGMIAVVFFSFFLTTTTHAAPRTVADALPTLTKDILPASGVEKTDVFSYSGKIIQVAFASLGLLFLALMIYAGFKWMTARGNEEDIKKARDTVFASLIGLIVILGASAVSSLIADRLIDENAGGDVIQNKIGDDLLGCCFDLVQTKGSQVSIGGQTFWADRVDTQAECERRGNDAKDKDDLIFGPGNWQFHAGKDASWCAAEVIPLNDAL